MRFLVFIFGSALLADAGYGQQKAIGAASASAAPRTMEAARRSGPVIIDGRLDEPAWASAPPSGDFVQSYPAPGKPAPDRTEVRVLYDDQAIYVGIRMFDAHPDSIAQGLARRDATAATGIYSDWVHVVIDSYHDRRTGFRFSTTPRAVQKDVFHSNDNNEDLNWDAVWEVATTVDSLGWIAEYRIPLSQLRFGADSAGERTWGFQVQRDIARRNERDSWAPWTPDQGGYVSRFGDLTGLRGITPPEQLEITPYVSSTFLRAPQTPGDPFFQSTKTTPKIGGDLKYGLPKGLTLSATINPDFGQVEVDPAVVNLSAFEISFPEKRPFFLEGSDVFAFGQVVRQNDYGGQTYLYSRRIGRRPQLGLPGARFTDIPLETTIATAAKITGKNGPWTLGILDAVTPEEHGQGMDAAGVRVDGPVEPLSNYFAGRVKRDFRRGATTVGAMIEQTTRAVGDSAFTPFLRSDATFGGVDFEHDMRQRSWVLSGFAGGSLVRGSERAIARTQRTSNHYFQRPDAPYLTYDSALTSMGGYITEGALQHNGKTFGSIAIKASSPGLELNDLGFQSRTGYRAISTLVGRQSYTADAHFRNWSAFVYQNDAWNWGNRPVYRGYAGRVNATLLNFWGVNAGGTYSPRYYDDALLRGGPEAAQPTSIYTDASVGTDSRRRVRLNLAGSYAHDEIGGYQKAANVSLDLRPTSTIHVNLGPTFTQLHDKEQYIGSQPDASATATYGRRYLLATLTQNTLSLDTRMDVTVSPTLSFVMYAQPFVSAGRYAELKQLLRPGSLDFLTYDTWPTGTTKPDFNVRSLRGNAVLRWDYRPGSSLYLVWQQERNGFEPFGEFQTRRDVGAIFRTVPTNVFLIKATYWIGR
ncbi:MAG: carbohydrate binding family 9 domain-containing protein [Gemmatimonadaceae bacterium]|nr:carbohydrate binding family 9 domain-containing protein [Gemmatimonadaceae bacterium]